MQFTGPLSVHEESNVYNSDPRISEPNETLNWEKHSGKMCCLPHRPLRDMLNVAVKCLCPCQPVQLDGQTWFKFSWAKYSCSEPRLFLSFAIWELPLERGLTVLSAHMLQDIPH